MYSPLLTVIVPFRNDPALPYLMLRLEELISSFPKKKELEFILVDSGSNIDSQLIASNICKKYNITYLYHDSSSKIFSIGEVRDFGVVHANGQKITFMDVDFRVPSNFWDRLLNFMVQFEVNDKKKSIFVVPALYLTQLGTEKFYEISNDDKYNQFLLKWLYGDETLVETMAFCTPMSIIDKYYYLSIGGHNSEFRGHGFEDFELYHRILIENNEFPKPDDYYLDRKSWNFNTYSGFRAKFSLLGRAAYAANLFIVHLWHPRPEQASFYNPDAMKKNRSIWQSIFREFENTLEHPEPLISKNSLYKKILILGRPKTNIVRCMRDVIPMLGTPLYINEFDFIDEDDGLYDKEFRQMLDHNDIDLILFNAPYGNKARQNIYEWSRKENFPYLVFERGALPDSWFFDSKGFNADSLTYNEEYWNIELDELKIESVKNYIYKCFNEKTPLELQDSRIGSRSLSDKLRIGGKKVLFIPFQRPSDSVVKYMSGTAVNFENFVQVIDKVALEMKKYGWIVLCKKHPLETVQPELVHAQYVPNETNFLDLIELCDAVFLINSGVGIYAMMAEKPCYILGNAFYQFDGINQSIDTCDPIVISNAILEGYKFDIAKMYKFIYYLLNHVYSFGTPTIVRKIEEDGSLRTLTRYVDFYHINIDNKFVLNYKYNNLKQVPTYAPLLEKYKLDIFQKKQVKKGKITETKKVESPKLTTKSKVNTNTERKGISAQIEKYERKTGFAYKLFLFTVRPFISNKKYDKLKNKPYDFFNDTKLPVIKKIGEIILK